MKIIMLCSGQGNQKALAHKIHSHVPLHAIVVCGGMPSTRRSLKEVIGRFRNLYRVILTGGLFRRAWFEMLRHYDGLYSEFPVAPRLYCGDVNSDPVIALIEAEQPSLVVVSGTNLLRPRLIDAICRFGRVMNLHTGISPYVKGGPNCTNWCLSLQEFDLIGNTVMWLDAGIDSGNLIATERTPITGGERFVELHIKVMDHGHGLYADAVQRFALAKTLPNVPQDALSDHRLFLSRQWKLPQMWRAILNFYVHYRRLGTLMPVRQGIQLVKLED